LTHITQVGVTIKTGNEPGADADGPVYVHSIYSNGNFVSDTGTSYAAPCAAGVGALVLSVNPKINCKSVREILQETCDKVGGVDYGTTGHHIKYGYGRINAANAVHAAKNKK
jgi:subtilisin family serine protease